MTGKRQIERRRDQRRLLRRQCANCKARMRTFALRCSFCRHEVFGPWTTTIVAAASLAGACALLIAVIYLLT